MHKLFVRSANLFGLAIGSSIGMLLFTVAYHGSHFVHVQYEVSTFRLPANELDFGLSDKVGQFSQENVGQFNPESVGQERPYRVGHENENNIDGVYFQNDSDVHKDNDEIARFLYHNIRILCFVTLGQDEEKLLPASHFLLEKRCNKLLYFSRYKTNSSNVIYVNVSNLGNDVTSPANEAFRYIAKNYITAADWFLRVDTRSYFILENLRYFLSSVYPGDPLYFGALANNVYGKLGFCSGFLLSRKALEIFAKELELSSTKRQADPDSCSITRQSNRADTLTCFQQLGIRTKDTTDNIGRSRFHCFHPILEINRSYPPWFTKTNPRHRENETGVSDYAISFGDVVMEKQLSIDAYVHHLRPYGIQIGRADLNR